MNRILIVDDHPIVREGLEFIISTVSDMEIADQAESAQEALDKIWKNDYDVVLLDLNMPGRSGLDIIKPIKTEKPETAILVMTMYSEEQYAIRVLKMGASGYISKKAKPTEMLNAIRKVANGGTYIPPSLAEKLVGYLKTEEHAYDHEMLSNREFEVMIKIATGKSIKKIAEELYIGPTTVSTHRKRILEKMGMKTNAEITEYALMNHLI